MRHTLCLRRAKRLDRERERADVWTTDRPPRGSRSSSITVISLAAVCALDNCPDWLNCASAFLSFALFSFQTAIMVQLYVQIVASFCLREKLQRSERISSQQQQQRLNVKQSFRNYHTSVTSASLAAREDRNMISLV